MNLYTIKYDYNKPTTQQLTIPTNTEYKVGVKATMDGEPIEIEPSRAALKQVGASTSIMADPSTYNGYVTFGLVTADAEEFKSYVLDVDGDTKADFALNIQTKKDSVGSMEVVTAEVLDNFVTDSDMETTLSSYATTSAMESYVDAQIGAVLSSSF